MSSRREAFALYHYSYAYHHKITRPMINFPLSQKTTSIGPFRSLMAFQLSEYALAALTYPQKHQIMRIV